MAGGKSQKCLKCFHLFAEAAPSGTDPKDTMFPPLHHGPFPVQLR